MKNRMILITILAATIISGVITGCGSSKDSTAKAASTTTAEKSSDTDKEQTEKKINNLEISVTVDNGWNSDSTPAILHVTSDKVDFCHAITPDADGGKGTTTVALENDTYTVESRWFCLRDFRYGQRPGNYRRIRQRYGHRLRNEADSC